MEHELIKHKIYEHADGDYLPPEDLALVKEHLAQCADCADEMKLWKNLRMGLRGMEIPRADSSVNRAVLREINGEYRRWSPPPTAQVWASALALAALLIYSAIPYNGTPTGAGETYLYASTGELGMEAILEGSALEPETAHDAAANPGEI